MTYDAVGNQQQMAGIALQYDGENRQIASTVNGVTTNYAYDGEGQRVQKTTGAAATVYVYDATGNEVAEYSTQTPAVGGTEYVTTDHLGSTRLVTNASGTAVACHDYLPFGEELLAPESGRSGCYASVDGVTQKFTGKERDTETEGSATPSGLDYFGARYFSSAQGRFTSTDPKQFNAKFLVNPQKWNKYAYTLNNPLALVDPDGKEEIKVTVRAFIPDSSFRFPAGIGPVWKGDGRSFSTAPNASSRAQATFTIETDPAKSATPLVGKPTFTNSGSAVDVYGLFTATANSNVTGSVTNNTRIDGTSVVGLSMTASDPLVPGAPPTGGTFTFNVSPGGSSVSMNGTIAAYPAFEVYVQNANTGAQGTLLQYTPAGTSANSPGALLTGATMDVRGRTTLPDKPKNCADQANCQQ